MSPFHALYGREPPPLVAAPPSASYPPNVAEVVRQRGELIVALRRNLEKAQQRMRASANRHRRDVEYAVGDRVLLKLQQYRQHSVARPLSSKLARRFYGPFEVVERIGPVAYRLKLPPGSRIHDVFHVSLLRPFVDSGQLVVSTFPSFFARGKAVARPTRVAERRTVWREGKTVEEGLLLWDDDDGQSPTWEPLELIEQRFPGLLLGDKEVLNGGGVDTAIPVVPPVSLPTELQSAPEQPREEEQPVFDTVVREKDCATPAPKSPRPKRVSRRPDKYGDYVSR